MTIDDDVAAILERLRRDRDTSLKALVNEALRRGLRDMTDRPKHREYLRAQSVDLGAVLVADIDNIGEALACAEGEAFR